MKIKILIVLILPVFLLVPLSNTYAQNASDEANSIRDKVKNKIEDARKNPKAAIGTITDKTETGIQVKSVLGEMMQVSLDPENTVFVKLGTKATSLKFADVAIGDFVAALGYQSLNTVIDAKRILVVSPISKPNRKVYMGHITEIDKKGLKINTLSGETINLTFGKNILVTEGGDKERKQIKTTSLDIDDLVIVSGTVTESALNSRRIHRVLEDEAQNSSPTNSPKPTE